MKIRSLILRSLLITAMSALAMSSVLLAEETLRTETVTDVSNEGFLTDTTPYDLVIIDFTQGASTNYFGQSGFTTTATTVQINNFEFNDAYSGREYIFDSVITGSGPIGISKATGSNLSVPLTFNKDMSGYSGSITTANADSLILKFTGDARAALAGTGAINTVVGATSAINFELGSGTSTITNSSINTRELNFNSSVSSGTIYEVYTNITTNILGGEAGVTTKITAGKSLTVSNTSTYSGALELASGSSLSMASGSSIGSLSMATDATLTVTGAAPALSVGSLSLTAGGGSTTYDINYDLSVDTLTIGSGVTAHLASGKTLSITGSSTGSLSLADGSTLSVSQGASVTGLTLADSTTFDLNVANGETSFTLGGPLDLTGISTININLSSATGFGPGHSYTLFSGSGLSTSDLDKFSITLVDGGGTLGALSVDGSGNLIYTINADRASLTWDSTTGGTWSTAEDVTPWLDGSTASNFANGDDVTFGNEGSGSVTIAGTVTAATLNVNSSSDYTFTSDATDPGDIAGGTALIKNGTGKLTIDMDSNSFTGGVELNGGSVSVDNTAALGSGTITFGGGTLELTSGVTELDFSKLAVTSGNVISLHLDGSNVTATDTDSGPVAGLSVSGTGTLTHADWFKIDRTAGVTVGEGATVNFTTNVDENSYTQITSIAGEGTLSFANTHKLAARVQQMSSTTGAGFTGTLKVEAGATVMIHLANTNEQNRFALEFGSRTSSIHLTSVNSTNDNTLYLNSLSGGGEIRYDGNVNSDQSFRHLDLEMLGDNEFDGYFLGDNANRMGNFIVSSAGEENYNLRWTNVGFTGNSTSEDARSLKIANASVTFAGATTTWDGVINLEEATAQLIYANTAAITRGTAAGKITGSGSVVIETTMGVTLNGVNDYSGKTILSTDAGLTLGNSAAAGTSAIELQSGATLTVTDGLTIGNDINATASASLAVLTDTSATFSGAITSAEGALITLGAGSYIFDGARVDSTALVMDAASSVTFKNSTLTEIEVSGPTSTSITTTEAAANGSGPVDISTYTLKGLADEFAKAIEGTLALDLGTLSGFEEKDITAFLLDGVTDIQLDHYMDMDLIINGKSYGVLGVTNNGVEGGYLYLYIPEPSTATLSLLALTALAARRRRHKQIA